MVIGNLICSGSVMDITGMTAETIDAPATGNCLVITKLPYCHHWLEDKIGKHPGILMKG